jgi:hypothetical protein
MTETDVIKLQVLSGHYSETFELLRNDVGKRDRMFLYILVVVFLLLLYMSAPFALSEWLNSYMDNQIGSSVSHKLVDASFVGLVLWIGLLSMSHSYFQIVLHIERQYNYVGQLERQLCKSFDGKAFIREGKHYQENRRNFSRWTKFIFWFLFPLLFLFFNIVWLFFLYSVLKPAVLYLIVDSIISVSVLVSLGFYLWALFKKQ